MCRNGGSTPARFGTRRAAGAVCLLGLLLAGVQGRPAGAQPSSSQLTGVEIGKPAGQALVHLQESWLQWMSSFYQDRPEEAALELQVIRDSLEQLGFERIPDLSIGAAVRAAESARQGNLARAEWGLEAAEMLDPGRPETSFAHAVWAWENGDRLQAVAHHLRGWARLFRLPGYRFLWLQSSVLMALAALLLAGAGFVLVALAIHGGALFRSLERLFGSRVPPPLRHLLTWPLLLWPLALPAGPVWLALYLSALLWAYLGWSGRAVLGFGWLVLGIAPLVVAAQGQRLAVALSPPAHAVSAVVEGRLYGGFFSDLGVLRSALPESPQVQALLGDVHRNMGQWEQARERYEQVLEVVSTDAGALINLGAYFFRKGDYGSAIQLFQRAAAADPRNAVAFFNLSQAYSDSYLFTEQRTALRQAREIDDHQVSRWLAETQAERVLTIDSGATAVKAIVGQLRSSWRASEPGPFGSWHYFSLALPLAALALALLFQRLLRSAGAVASLPLVPGRPARLLRVAVPGLQAMVEGGGMRSYLALLLPAALLTVVLGRGSEYSIPWGLHPGSMLSLGVGLGGLAVIYLGRVWWELHHGV
jgi:tetratricopeptide (TPR) repeat protein